MNKANNKMSRGGPVKKDVGEFYDLFTTKVATFQKKIETNEEGKSMDVDVIDVKTKNGFNGLETSTFTVCSRIRPLLPMDEGGAGDRFVCIVKGESKPSAKNYTEPTVALVPKITLRGQPTLEPLSLNFDYSFGPETNESDLFNKVGKPLVTRAMAGQVGVVFAYGQTGSGKTHTMSSLMTNIADEIYTTGAAKTTTISFSYLQIAGQVCTDCLDSTAVEGAVKIGELLDGRMQINNLKEVVCATAEEFGKHLSIAEVARATECTERNAASSRSHGIGIIHFGHSSSTTDPDSPQPQPGVLYVIDLAGSERMADSKNHSDKRLEETKAINLSLLALKECIRARTMAGTGDGTKVIHVPYRRSKLTLLMKDVFDIGCKRLSSTVILAHVSPLARDVKHSLNTLQYAAPLRVSVLKKKKGRVVLEKDTRDPALWSHQQVSAWIQETLNDEDKNCLKVSHLISTGEGGLELCMVTEPEFFRRVRTAYDKESTSKSNAVAKTLYDTLWTLICDAKVRRRRPDGTLITPEQEAAEQKRAEEEMAAKAALWAEREKHMKSDLVGYDGKPL